MIREKYKKPCEKKKKREKTGRKESESESKR